MKEKGKGFMDMFHQKKKFTVFFLVILLVLVMGGSFAISKLTFSGNRRVTIEANGLTLFLDESKTTQNIKIESSYPVKDEVGMKNEDYSFSLVNRSGVPMKYTIYIVEDEVENKTPANFIRYFYSRDIGNIEITRNMTENVDSTGRYVLESDVIENDTTYSYTYKMWLDYNADNTAMNTNYSVHLEIEAEEREILPMIKAVYGMITKGEFWNYKNQITSVVFEPAINVPEGVESWDVTAYPDRGLVMSYIENTGTVIVNDEELPAYRLHIQAIDKIYANVSSSSLFGGFENLVSVEGLEYFDTSKTKSMNRMFWGCTNLIDLDVSNFNTSNVTNMALMFEGCSSLTSLDLSVFNTSNVTSMDDMFQGCSSLTSLDLSNFDTSSVTTMSGMFVGCSGLTDLNLSSFNTQNVTTMRSIFSGCSSLSSLDISSFDFTSVTSSEYMFSNVPANSQIIVKDESARTWVLGVRNDLTNVQVKGA